MQRDETDEGVTAAVMALEDARQRLAELQVRHNIDAPTVDLRLAGLVEAWAAGCTWEQVMQVNGVAGPLQCLCKCLLVVPGCYCYNVPPAVGS